MYTPKCFQQNDRFQLNDFIASYPLATLVCSTSTDLEANHIPLYCYEDDNNNCVLRGHIAKANSLWKTVKEKSKVLAVFQGPQSYISPTWYPTKKEDGKVVPTWNYAAVYVNGEISFITDNEWKLDMLHTLTNNLEQKEVSPWKVSDAPKEYIKKQLAAIIGVEISVNSLRGKWKLSQNQVPKNQEGVIQGLSQSRQFGADTLVNFMKKADTDIAER